MKTYSAGTPPIIGSVDNWVSSRVTVIGVDETLDPSLGVRVVST